MGNRLAVLCGNRLGVDHVRGDGFAGPTDSPGTFHVPLAKWLQWYWTVKRFRVDASMGFATDTGTPYTGTFSFDMVRGGVPGFVTHEYQLTEVSPNFSGQGEIVTSLPGDHALGSVSISMFANGYRASDKTFSLTLAASFLTGAGGVAQLFQFIGLSSIGALDFDGYSVPVYPFGFIPGEFPTTFSGTVEMVDFFPFRNRAGQDVYNSAGAIIHDPFG